MVLEWVGRVLEGYGRYGMGWRGPGRSQRHGMERLLQPHQQQRLQTVHRARLRTLQLGGGRGQRSGVRGQSTRSEVKIGGGPFKGAGRRRMALEGSWKDMEGMGSRDAMGGAGPLRAAGRGGVVLEWVGRVLEGQTDMEVRGCDGGCGPFKSRREGKNGIGMGWKGPGRTWKAWGQGMQWG